MFEVADFVYVIGFHITIAFIGFKWGVVEKATDHFLEESMK